MVDVPNPALLAGHRDLARYNDPAPKRLRSHLIARKELRMLLEIALEQILGVIWRLGHLDELTVTQQEDAALGHRGHHPSAA
jgi:hypothetical protein